jgi:hypothetical protein
MINNSFERHKNVTISSGFQMTQRKEIVYLTEDETDQLLLISLRKSACVLY